MIMAGDLHLAGRFYLYRLVAAAVTKFQFVGLRPQGQPQNLVAQADAEKRLLPEQRLHGVDGLSAGGRVAGAIGEKNAIRL